MKKLSAILFTLTCFTLTSHSQILKKLGNKVKTKASQRADQKVDQGIDKGLDKTEEIGQKKDNSSTNGNDNTTPTTTNNSTSGNQSTGSPKDTLPTSPAALKVYSNFDFVPGDTVVFEDHFSEDRDGEFPSHWDLINGQGVLNQFNGYESFNLTEGNYARVAPLMKKKSYLTNTFTIEFDIYNPDNGAYGLNTFFKDATGNELGKVMIDAGGISVAYSDDRQLTGSYPAEAQYDNFKNKWHHISIAYKDKQIKVYMDQYRVTVVPNSGFVPVAVEFGGIGDLTFPIIFTNIRIADGGKMNMLGKKFTDTKIITHGINFDVNKATIKPESMGTLNMIVQVLKDNPTVKFEVGGHTDADGANDYNLKLSQQRSEAVKDQLIKMGVEPTRLTAKGYGESKPISDNTSMDGKANNRRVEFVVIK